MPRAQDAQERGRTDPGKTVRRTHPTAALAIDLCSTDVNLVGCIGENASNQDILQLKLDFLMG